ncbi:hypothetical protein ACNKHL_01660 [Shigella flexneri]
MQFSAYAQSRARKNSPARSGNSCDYRRRAEMIRPARQHYGTDEQKDHDSAALARGQEIPCFALTSPEAGSDSPARFRTPGIVRMVNGRARKCWGCVSHL